MLRARINGEMYFAQQMFTYHRNGPGAALDLHGAKP
jgi:hypothetical protein